MRFLAVQGARSLAVGLKANAAEHGLQCAQDGLSPFRARCSPNSDVLEAREGVEEERLEVWPEVDVITPLRDEVRDPGEARKVSIGDAIDEGAVNVQDEVSDSLATHGDV